MASKQSTVDFIAEQIAKAGMVATRKMFGEHALYCNGKLVALVCDDRLFIKPTAGGRALLGEAAEEAPPYPGAKNYFLIPEEAWEEGERLTELVRVTAAELPVPKPKKKAEPKPGKTKRGVKTPPK